MPLFPFCVLVVTDDGLDRLLALHRLLLWPEELHPDALTQRVEVFIKEKFLHLLVDGGELLNQHPPHDVLILLRLDVLFLPVENLREGMFEPPIQPLRLGGNSLHGRANDRRMLLFVVPPQQRHLLDDPEEQMQHIGGIEQHLEGLPLPHGQTAGLQVLLPGGTALLQEVVVGTQEFTIQPVIPRHPRPQVLLQEREPVLAVDEQQVGDGQRADDLQWILRGRRQEFLQFLGGGGIVQFAHQLVWTAPAVDGVGQILEAVHFVLEEEHQRLHSTRLIYITKPATGRQGRIDQGKLIVKGIILQGS